MRIDPGDEVCGLPARDLREFFRHNHNYEWQADVLAEWFGLAEQVCSAIISSLQQEGFIRATGQSQGHPWYELTIKGNALRIASAAKPIRRATADAAIASFLERVARLNADDHFLYRVTRAMVFGSYLSDRQLLNDVDIAIELAIRTQDDEEYFRKYRETVKRATEAGRKFASNTEELYWPYNEVFLFLKNRSRSISLVSSRDGVLNVTQTKLIYECGG